MQCDWLCHGYSIPIVQCPGKHLLAYLGLSRVWVWPGHEIGPGEQTSDGCRPYLELVDGLYIVGIMGHFMAWDSWKNARFRLLRSCSLSMLQQKSHKKVVDTESSRLDDGGDWWTGGRWTITWITSFICQRKLKQKQRANMKHLVHDRYYSLSTAPNPKLTR